MLELTPALDPTAPKLWEALLWEQAEPHFEQLKNAPEEKIMWIPDIRPDAGWLAGAVIATAVVSPAVQAADHYTMGVCRVARQSAGAEIVPITDGGSYLFMYHGNDPRYKEKLSSGQFFADAKITLIKVPKHGKLVVEEGPWSRTTDYRYLSQESYIGRDRFVMQVEKDGVKVRLHYLMEVIANDEPTSAVGDYGVRDIFYCDPEHWKISSTPSIPDDANLAALMSDAVQHLTFADLTNNQRGRARIFISA